MNRMPRTRTERAFSIVGRMRQFGWLKLLGLMALLGCLLGMVSVHLIPTFLRLGLSARAADKLPYFGFFGGLFIGFSAPLSRAAMQSLKVGLALLLLPVAAVGSLLTMTAGLVWAIEMVELLPIVAVLVLGSVLITVLIDKLTHRPGPPRA